MVERLKVVMVKEEGGLELELSCSVLKKRDRRMVTKLRGCTITFQMKWKGDKEWKRKELSQFLYIHIVLNHLSAMWYPRFVV